LDREDRVERRERTVGWGSIVADDHGGITEVNLVERIARSDVVRENYLIPCQVGGDRGIAVVGITEADSFLQKGVGQRFDRPCNSRPVARSCQALAELHDLEAVKDEQPGERERRERS